LPSRCAVRAGNWYRKGETTERCKNVLLEISVI
jgi:hypothetical protein